MFQEFVIYWWMKHFAEPRVVSPAFHVILPNMRNCGIQNKFSFFSNACLEWFSFFCALSVLMEFIHFACFWLRIILQPLFKNFLFRNGSLHFRLFAVHFCLFVCPSPPPLFLPQVFDAPGFRRWKRPSREFAIPYVCCSLCIFTSIVCLSCVDCSCVETRRISAS